MDRIGRRWPSYALFIPWVLLFFGVLLGFATPPWLNTGPLLALTCVTAGVITTLRTTAWISVLALVATLLIRYSEEGYVDSTGVTNAVYIAVAGLIGLDLNRLLDRYGVHLKSVTSVAEAAQYALLPNPPSSVAGFGIAASYKAAQRDARIGGDLYAVADTPYGLRVLLGDVRGKGMGAVSTVSLLLGAFRERAHEAATLPELVDRLEDALARNTDRDGGAETLEAFTTAVLAELPCDGSRVRLLNCGHPSPYAISPSGVRRLDPAECDLPLGTGLGGRRTPPGDFLLDPGTTLVLLTDGITEARDSAGTFFDPLLGLRDLPATDPDTVLHTLLERVDTWSGRAESDDRAVLAIGVPRTGATRNSPAGI
ncbi:PP2C family protein-serine/threonine phosphatase [Streptomyces sp. NPDC060194]|uniref:PP2C family protein-serine/threonine phosphatase n=1 Tax=Streptomyces sp. NPDC060194 TaxID=3347069 RepID=UPI003650CA5B